MSKQPPTNHAFIANTHILHFRQSFPFRLRIGLQRLDPQAILPTRTHRPHQGVLGSGEQQWEVERSGKKNSKRKKPEKDPKVRNLSTWPIFSCISRCIFPSESFWTANLLSSSFLQTAPLQSHLKMRSTLIRCSADHGDVGYSGKPLVWLTGLAAKLFAYECRATYSRSSFICLEYSRISTGCIDARIDVMHGWEEQSLVDGINAES